MPKSKYKIINIIYVTSFIGEKGPNNQLAYLIANLPQHVVPFVYVLGQRMENDNTILIEKKAKVFYGCKSFVMSWLSFFEISRIIKTHNVKLLQSFGFRCDILSLFVFREITKIVVVRNLTMINWVHISRLGCVFGRIHLFVINRFDFVVSCSEAVSQHLRLANIESVVISNSIPHSRSCCSIPKVLKRFVTVSSSVPGKNIEFLLSSFSVNPELKKCVLLVAGYVDPVVQSNYRDFPNIEFAGYVVNMRSIFYEADAFISASTHEGLPNAVLEALSSYRPVFLSNIPSHVSIISLDYRLGGVFVNNSTQSLVESISNKKTTLSCLSCSLFDEFLESNFSAERMANKYVRLYYMCT